jgi:hypothetical protein
MVKKKRSIGERLRGKQKISENEPIISITKTLLHEEADV